MATPASSSTDSSLTRPRRIWHNSGLPAASSTYAPLISARRAHLRVASRSVLLGGAGVQARQHLTGLDAVAGLDRQREHSTGYLGCDHGLAHCLDHSVES